MKPLGKSETNSGGTSSDENGMVSWVHDFEAQGPDSQAKMQSIFIRVEPPVRPVRRSATLKPTLNFIAACLKFLGHLCPPSALYIEVNVNHTAYVIGGFDVSLHKGADVFSAKLSH